MFNPTPFDDEEIMEYFYPDCDVISSREISNRACQTWTQQYLMFVIQTCISLFEMIA